MISRGVEISNSGGFVAMVCGPIPWSLFFLFSFFLISGVICFRYQKPYAVRGMKRKKPISHNNRALHLRIAKIKHSETIEKAPLT